MTIYERQEKIMNFLKEKHFSTIKELALLVFASESSVRRDIKFLERKGYITQIYGGVVLSEYQNSVVPLNVRDAMSSSVKDVLAKRASNFISEGDTIIIDGSSTARRIIKYLDKFNNLKIITNNQKIFCEYDGKHEIYCTGGRFINKSNIFAGSFAENFINSITADIVFFSSQAISEDGEISDISEEETQLRKAMLSRSKKKIFLCDSSKIGIEKTFKLCSKNEIDKIICNEKLPWE